MSTLNTRLHMFIHYLPVPRDSIWSYMIWLVKSRTRLLVNDATLPRVTSWLSVNVGEVSCLLALGWELLTALFRTPVLSR